VTAVSYSDNSQRSLAAGWSFREGVIATPAADALPVMLADAWRVARTPSKMCRMIRSGMGLQPIGSRAPGHRHTTHSAVASGPTTL
jgi:hypothetical protein